MKKIILLCATLVFIGCNAQGYTAKTVVSVSTSPDGTCQASYASDKEQQGLEAEVCGGKIKVDKSGTLESIVAAQAANNAALAKILEALLAAARNGALSGS